MSRRGIHPLLMGLDKPARKIEKKEAELTHNQSALVPFSRFCAQAYQAPSGGDGFLFCSLVLSFIWISRRGLSAHSR